MESQFSSVRPLGWADLLKYHRNPPTVAFPRDPIVEAAYERCREKFDLTANIKRMIGGAPRDTPVYQFNTFPYLTADGIVHLVVWFVSEKEMDSTCMEEIIEKDLLSHSIHEFVFFTNPKVLQSMPGISHCHLFLKCIDDYMSLTNAPKKG
jgi:hypothetical protein